MFTNVRLWKKLLGSSEALPSSVKDEASCTPISQGCNDNQMCKNGRGLALMWLSGLWVPSCGAEYPGSDSVPGNCQSGLACELAETAGVWGIDDRQRVCSAQRQTQLLLQAKLLPLPLEHLGTFSLGTPAERAVAQLRSTSKSLQGEDSPVC